MKYFLVDTLGDLDDEDYCLLDKVPDGIGVKYSFLARGRRVGSDYPTDARIHMSEDRSGIKLGSLIGSTKNFLIVHCDVKDVIEAACQGVEVEYLPFSLINHKGRVHSSDYFIVNPIGTRDCLDAEASDITYYKETEKVLRIDRMVIDPVKVDDAPPLFRIKQAPSKYVINEDLARKLIERGFDNLLLTEIEQIPEGE